MLNKIVFVKLAGGSEWNYFLLGLPFLIVLWCNCAVITPDRPLVDTHGLWCEGCVDCDARGVGLCRMGCEGKFFISKYVNAYLWIDG